jgi:hypothetical protein
MARNGRQQSSGESRIQEGGAGKPSLYQEVTDRIIRELEQGRVPRGAALGSAQAALNLPKNAATGRAYSGINVFDPLGGGANLSGCRRRFPCHHFSDPLGDHKSDRLIGATVGDDLKPAGSHPPITQARLDHFSYAVSGVDHIPDSCAASGFSEVVPFPVSWRRQPCHVGWHRQTRSASHIAPMKLELRGQLGSALSPSRGRVRVHLSSESLRYLLSVHS